MIIRVSDDVCIDPESVIALKKTTIYNRAFGLEIHMRNGNTIILPNGYTKEKVDEMIDKIVGDGKNESE